MRRQSQSSSPSEAGFSLVEILIATVILAGAFVMILGLFPMAALQHRGALEKEIASSLAQGQLEFFLSSPGPVPGATGTTTDFSNTAQFPPDYTGTFQAYSMGSLTIVVVRVTPPHGNGVELSAIDTTARYGF
jgi:Tfp pilus assembly protein PilV